MSEKVKAHLTREEAERAGVPFMQRVGNEWADTMATRGTEAHGQWKLEAHVCCGPSGKFEAWE
eukprot:8809268-Alexandrium_andersonii.AAC.1